MNSLPIWRVNAALPGLNVPFFIRSAEKPTHDQINEVWMRKSKTPLKDPATTRDLPLRDCYPSYAGVDLIAVEDLETVEDGMVAVTAETLRQLVGAAESYAEDLSTGLDDGIYDEDPGLAEIEAAIKVANAELEQL